MSSMTTPEIVDCLRVYADASARAALTAAGSAGRARLNFMASLMLEAADRVVLLNAEVEQLRTRLLRQASWFEQFEARTQPEWPLLEDDDCDPGAAV